MLDVAPAGVSAPSTRVSGVKDMSMAKIFEGSAVLTDPSALSTWVEKHVHFEEAHGPKIDQACCDNVACRYQRV